MQNKLSLARKRLQEGGYTCVVLFAEGEYHSFDRGVKPLLSLLREGISCKNAVAADKTVGAGAAHLYVLLGIRALWANVISQPALKVLKQNGIEVSYGELAVHIINRKGDGICPIEQAVAGVQTSDEAYERIVQTLAILQ